MNCINKSVISSVLQLGYCFYLIVLVEADDVTNPVNFVKITWNCCVCYGFDSERKNFCRKLFLVDQCYGTSKHWLVWHFHACLKIKHTCRA